jgi:hypothetical protein
MPVLGGAGGGLTRILAAAHFPVLWRDIFQFLGELNFKSNRINYFQLLPVKNKSPNCEIQTPGHSNIANKFATTFLLARYCAHVAQIWHGIKVSTAIP